jgi:hypothetical protein
MERSTSIPCESSSKVQQPTKVGSVSSQKFSGPEVVAAPDEPELSLDVAAAVVDAVVVVPAEAVADEASPV